MKHFLKNIAPALYGLLVYITIRLVNDTVGGYKIWEQWWVYTLAEVVTSILLGYATFYMMKRLEKGLLKKKWADLTIKDIRNDFFKVYLYIFLLTNAIAVPTTSMTNDGMSLFDFVHINTIPILYSLLLYAIMRGNVFMKAYIENQLKVEKVKSEQLKSELAYLKAQIHPHFLFNALNTIYFEMDESVESAKYTMEKFSDLLRYQLYSKENEPISLDKEFTHLKNYIALQAKRTSSKLKLQVGLPEHVSKSFLVHPFLMLPLVENAFKYVAGDYCLEIKAVIVNQRLCFEVKNSISSLPTIAVPDSGIGLKNLKRRLELLYDGKHNFSITQENTYFKVSLEVDLIVK